MGGNIVYRPFLKLQGIMLNMSPFIIFSIKVVVIQQKISCFQIVSIMYCQYI